MSKIYCDQGVIDLFQKIRADTTSGYKYAGFLIGNYCNSKCFIYHAFHDSRFSTYLETNSKKNFSFDIIKNMERRMAGGLYIVGYFSYTPLSEQDLQYLKDRSKNHLKNKEDSFLYFSPDHIPDMTVIPATVVDVSIHLKMHINHKEIISADGYAYLHDFCSSLVDQTLIECNSQLLETSVHLADKMDWKLYLLNTESPESDGVATFLLPLRFAVFEGECVGCVKQAVAECIYRMLIQSCHISVVSGCRVEQSDITWGPSCMTKVENSEKIVYYWHDPTKTTMSRMLFLAMIAFLVIFVYIRSLDVWNTHMSTKFKVIQCFIIHIFLLYIINSFRSYNHAVQFHRFLQQL